MSTPVTSLTAHLSSLQATDLSIDPYGRLIISNQAISDAIKQAVPGITTAADVPRIAGVTNNCNCPKGDI